MSTKHSPLPWGIDTEDACPIFDSKQHNIFIVLGRRIKDVCLDNANIEHIVRCVNSHDALVAALRDAEDFIVADAADGNLGRALATIRAALAAAEGT